MSTIERVAGVISVSDIQHCASIVHVFILAVNFILRLLKQKHDCLPYVSVRGITVIHFWFCCH
jgi:hypothetical protein